MFCSHRQIILLYNNNRNIFYIVFLVIYGAQLEHRKRSKHSMLMLGLNETIDQVDMLSSVCSVV